ncbi:unnamed protein product [Ascophyllum nodosum]
MTRFHIPFLEPVSLPTKCPRETTGILTIMFVDQRPGKMKWFAVILMIMTVAVCQAFVSGGISAIQGLAAAGGPPRRLGINHLKMADVVVEFTRTGKTVGAVVGTPLSQLCAKNGIKVKYNCKQGNCATCVIDIDGRNVKACQGKVPSSRRIIKIKA